MVLAQKHETELMCALEAQLGLPVTLGAGSVERFCQTGAGPPGRFWGSPSGRLALNRRLGRDYRLGCLGGRVGSAVVGSPQMEMGVPSWEQAACECLAGEDALEGTPT